MIGETDKKQLRSGKVVVNALQPEVYTMYQLQGSQHQSPAMHVEI